MMNRVMTGFLIGGLLCCVGCAGVSLRSSSDRTSSLLSEPQWIRDGRPVLFEGEPWFPTDDVENLLDSEVYRVFEDQGVPFFVEETDVRPWARLYTRFSKDRYRAFEKR
ncbi:MAG: hypothetical protein GX606_01510 [Elusimicrobia bacterium]|nr:hypothetical protein [Elusimicrobiota bacterium]